MKAPGGIKHREPVQNDPADPLISILVYNYDGQYLGRCLDSIFSEDTLSNFEVILLDDATTDGSWETALEYVEKYPGLITIHRNRKVLGQPGNLRHCLGLSKGRYYTVLTENQAFLPRYIGECVDVMMSDPYARFGLVCRVEDPLPLPMPLPVTLPLPLPSMSGRPLVSILCYNFNYGQYLRQSLESIFAQTYDNIELCFSDNASTDDSWSIALEFVRKYPGKMHVTRNRKNFGPDANFGNCRHSMTGKYYVNFCSDDALDAGYVSCCVNALEAYPNAGMAIVNRAIIDEHNRRTEEAPFYDRSCIIPGEEQAAVYMMAGVNPSVSQIMYRRELVDGRTATGGLATRYYGTRILDFNISIDFDVVYINEPLLLHRIHSRSDTSQADANLMPVVGLYVLNHQFADIASVRNLAKVAGRLPESIDKLARLAVRYSVRSLLSGEELTAHRYFHLAMAMNPRLATEPVWQQLGEFWSADEDRRREILEQFRSSGNLVARSISYEPPPGSVRLSADAVTPALRRRAEEYDECKPVSGKAAVYAD